MTRKDLGGRGETLAAEYLRRQGCRVIDQNYRTRLGELDLIVQDGPELVFVEVKTRVGGRESTPQESVTRTKVERLVRLAQAYLQATGRDEEMYRIDVVAITVEPAGLQYRVEHLRNAVY